MVKICVYIPTASFFVGGGEIVPLNQSKYLSKKGYKVTVLVLKVDKETSFFKNFKKENPEVKIEYLKTNTTVLNIKGENLTHELGHALYFSLGRQLSDYLLRNNFDIVLTHYAPAALFVPASIKQILFIHGIPQKKQVVNDIAVRLSDKLVAVSKSVSIGWQKMFDLHKKIKVIHNGIDVSHFFPVTNQMKNIDILFVGRLIRIKGVQHLIEAVNLIHENFRQNLNVVIGGKGPYLKVLKELVKQHELGKVIHFKGYLPEEKLNLYYNRSKIVVLPSYAKEGVLTTLLEAAATGRAIITANCCGMIEFIEDKKNGLLFEPRNPIDLQEKIQLLLTNNSLRTKLGNNARKKILKNWTWEHSITQLENLIKQLL